MGTGRVGGGELFPGATGVTHLQVYDWPTVDGLAGGSPHLHTASAEGYLVLSGTGTLQSLSGLGYAETPLAPGVLLWFTPGTVHRLVNTGGDLEIVVVMQNSGLPEAGDAVLTFPAPLLADPEAYARAAALPVGADAEVVAEAARRRRDLAVEGYLELRAQVIAGGPGALDGLYRAAVTLVGPRLAQWRGLWQDRPQAQAVRTGVEIDAMAAGSATHLGDSGVYTAPGRSGPPGYGMCGRLRVWDMGSSAPVQGSATARE